MTLLFGAFEVVDGIQEGFEVVYIGVGRLIF